MVTFFLGALLQLIRSLETPPFSNHWIIPFGSISTHKPEFHNHWDADTVQMKYYSESPSSDMTPFFVSGLIEPQKIL
jgi:hypothetical protein